MTRLRVWAPRPHQVELVLGTGGAVQLSIPMERGHDGWWAVEAAEAVPGSDYMYRLDGEGPFPDPRSAYQPGGVHGPSRIVAHGDFSWTDAGWSAGALADAVLYELHVGTFSPAGTFDGAIERLDHLVDLGVTHLELMPVAEFPGERGWGYDGVDLFAPHHAYGGPDGLRRLVDACHTRGLAVLLDVAYNHLGPDGNYLARFGPYFSSRCTTPWGEALNFDGPGADEVRAFVVDNALAWLRDYHLDGLRLDAVQEIHDRSAVHILEELADAVHQMAAAAGRRLVVIAESDLNAPQIVREVAAGGYGLDAQWNDDFGHSLHVALTGETHRYLAQYDGLGDLATSLREVFVFSGRYSSFRGRSHGRPVGDVPATRFIGFLQNHDQVGNRALGERSGHLVPVAAQKVGLAVVLLGPFVPLLFAGEEWGASTPFHFFTAHEDPGLAEAVREGRAVEMAPTSPDGQRTEVPDPQDAATFSRSRLRWEERAAAPHAELLAWTRALIELRRAQPALRDGSRPDVLVDPVAGWLRFTHGPMTVAIATMPARVPMSSADGKLVLASSAGIEVGPDGLTLPGTGVAVLVAG